MPRDGALILTDVRGPTLTIVCEPCDRRGRLSVAKLIEEHGDAKLTDLLVTSPTAPRRRCLISTTSKPPLPSGRAWRPDCDPGAFESVASIAANASAVTEIVTIQPLL